MNIVEQTQVLPKVTEKEYNKKYYSEHKNVWKDKYGASTKCDCGVTVAKWNLAKHQSTKAHQQRLRFMQLPHELFVQLSKFLQPT